MDHNEENDAPNQASRTKSDNSQLQNEDILQDHLENKDCTPQEKIELINQEACILGQTLKVMLSKFKNFETRIQSMEYTQKEYKK